jgi:hypothetical protein
MLSKVVNIYLHIMATLYYTIAFYEVKNARSVVHKHKRNKYIGLICYYQK